MLVWNSIFNFNKNRKSESLIYRHNHIFDPNYYNSGSFSTPFQKLTSKPLWLFSKSSLTNFDIFTLNSAQGNFLQVWGNYKKKKKQTSVLLTYISHTFFFFFLRIVYIISKALISMEQMVPIGQEQE